MSNFLTGDSFTDIPTIMSNSENLMKFKNTFKAKWLLFLNRPADYEVTDNSFICSRHFEPTYLKVTAKNLARLNYTLDPIPTIHPELNTKSEACVLTKSRPPPKERICKQDEISIFEEKFRIRRFLDVVEFLKQAPEYVDF